mmetsp:Transcript_26627/g.53502  ORF Transcript_26627/g.53502 Transcript_26627/m.53502 type:complete len:232 (-) Transcript_26627:175-870(-)
MVSKTCPHAFAREAHLVANRVNMHGELDETVGVAPLIVVPRDELAECIVQRDAGARVEDGGARIALEVGGDDLVLSVSEDALVGGILGLRLHDRLDLIVRGGLSQLARKVNNRHVGGGHTEGHAGELAVESRQDLADRLGSTSRGRDDVLAGTTSATPILEGRAIDGLLGGGGRVDRGHETLNNAPFFMHDLGEGPEAVGRARRIGQDVDVLGVCCVVHRHNKHWRISRGC